MADLPPIPMQAADRPTVAGLVVPWITIQDPKTGRHQFGAVDHTRAAMCILNHRCQICGKPLDPRRMVVLARDQDLLLHWTAEPALHPACAAYSLVACPMLAGRQTHHRSTPHRVNDSVTADPAGQQARLGAPADPWHQLWLSAYQPRQGPGDRLGVGWLFEDVLRIRPVTGGGSRV